MKPEHEAAKKRFMARLRAAWVLAGGSELDDKEFEVMTLDVFLDLCIPNGVILIVTYQGPCSSCYSTYPEVPFEPQIPVVKEPQT